MRTLRTWACLALLLVLPAVRVRAADDGDDFDDDSVNADKWGPDQPSGAGQLSEINERLEFTVATPTSDDQVDRPWLAGVGPYDMSWEVQIELFDGNEPTGDTSVTSLGLNVISTRDASDDFFAELYVSRTGGPPVRRGFHAEIEADGIALPYTDSGALGVTSGAVRVRFDAATKVLAADYDVDPSDGYAWMPFASFGLAGNGGLDGNADFAMTDTDRFDIEVYGYGAHQVVTSGEVYADHFLTKDLVPVTPGIVLDVTDHDHRWHGDPLIAYRISVRNDGVDRTGLVLREIVPVATTFSAADSSPGWTCAPNPDGDDECALPIGDLATGESVDATFATRVDEGTTPGFDILNEASVNPTTHTVTLWELCTALASNPTACCILRYIQYFACISCNGSTPLPAVARSGIAADVEPLTYYRLRDRVFHRTAGGRRLVDLFYTHSPDLVLAASGNPALASLARTNLLAWQPAVRALADGAGADMTVSAEQVQGFDAFLDALAPVATPALRTALLRERALIDVDGWPGLTMTQVLARVEAGVSCVEADTFESVRCRFAQLATLVERLVPAGKIETRLAGVVAQGAHRLDGAEHASKTRARRAGLRKASKALGAASRRLGSKAGHKAIPADVDDMLLAETAALRTAVDALRAP